VADDEMRDSFNQGARDSLADLRQPIAAWFPGASDLRAISWAHVRVRGAAERATAWPTCASFKRSTVTSNLCLRAKPRWRPRRGPRKGHRGKRSAWRHASPPPTLTTQHHRTTRRNRAAAGRRSSHCDRPSADLPSHSGRASHGSAIGYARASRHDATDCTV
jgi:hypothetical protein